MKPNHTQKNPCSTLAPEVPDGFCRKLIDRLDALKEDLAFKFLGVLPERETLVQQLITDAEVLAWETSFPHLFLVDFAELRFAEVLANQRGALAQAA